MAALDSWAGGATSAGASGPSLHQSWSSAQSVVGSRGSGPGEWSNWFARQREQGVYSAGGGTYSRWVEENELELIARCRQGDAEAWELLFSIHHQPVARFVFQSGPGLVREDVEEICQEVFLAVVHHLGSFEGKCRLQTWICRIALNKLRDFWDKKCAVKRGAGAPVFSLQEEKPDGRVFDPPSNDPSPDASLDRKDQLEWVGRLVSAMDEPCREIIQLRYFADLSYEEISGALNLNQKTVSSRLSKCLDRLHRLMESAEKTEGSSFSSV